MMRSKSNTWLSGVGVGVLVGGLVLANFGGGITSAQAHDHDYKNPFKQIMNKLNEILTKLNQGGGGGGSGGEVGNYTMRWDTNHPSGSRFTTVFDGAVLDKNTGLVWEQSPAVGASRLMKEAQLECLNKAVVGPAVVPTRGWRLPSAAELVSLIDPKVLVAPHVEANVFKDVQSGPYWSATTDAQSTGFGLSVNFNDGSVSSNNKFSERANVWCVRGAMS